MSLIGREREIATALGALQTVKSTPVARSLAIEGISGIGKTALLAAVRERLPSWLQFGTSAHRIQQSLPFGVVRRLVTALFEALGESSSRYAAGLGEMNAGDPGAMLLRLIEGVTLDHSVLIAVDDAQWMDEESADALTSILTNLSDRALALFVTERADSSEPPSRLDADTRITLGPLDRQASVDAARAEYPDAPPDVVDAIVAHSGGHPIDLVTLAQSARDRGARDGSDVAASLRAVTVRNIQLLPAQLREFLQIVSLLNEPIDYNLLRRIWPNEQQLVSLIAASSERFLLQEGTDLRFAHAMLADAVLETIPVAIPMRRRIINALQNVSSPTLEDRLQLAEQAEACGDRVLAIATLSAVAMEAIERGQARLTISVSEQLLKIGEPTDDMFIPFYVGYGRALHFIDRLDRASEVLQHALEEAARRKLPGGAAIAAQLVLEQWFSDQNERAINNYNRFTKEYTAPLERVALLAAGMWFALCDADTELFARIDAEFAALGVPLSPELAMRREIVRAYLMTRVGNFTEARSAISRVEEVASSVPDALRNVAQFARALIELFLLGVDATNFAELRARFGQDENGSLPDYLYAWSELIAGRYHDAFVVVEATQRSFADPIHRRRMLMVAAALSVMQDQPSPFVRLIENEVARLLTGERGVWLMPLASWTTLLPQMSDARARVLSRIVLSHLAKPSDPIVITLVSPLAVSARKRGDTELLQSIAQPGSIWEDKRPLIAADLALARALAREALGKGSSREIEAACDECRNLGMTVLVELAARAARKQSAPKAESTSPLTARERQIANQVAQGKSNREIAEELVLSERTVEGHIANIFNKLNVSSRTQVAAWVLRATTA
ncbi:MAG: AAA family ATPase [Candidatus Eremiobacteraeota bacterium]|nr:AAA family ATPase [Candidatus Eremiobacteraeota bacterium]